MTTELQSLDYSHDGTLLRGQLARPKGPGPHPGVLVMHDARGLGDLARQRASDLAAAGYVALATDMYGGGQRHEDPRDIAPLFTDLHGTPGRLRDRVLAGYEALRALPDVDPDRIVAIGFCFGGQCVLELARSGAEVKAVVSFHGLLTTDQPARRGEVKAKVMVLTGGKDPYAPAEHVAGVQAEMAQAGADLHLTIYSEALHAFTDPNARDMTLVPGVRYDPLVARLSWAQATAFLEACVGG